MKLSPERLRAISHNIKQTRLERGLTQEKVAELAGITAVYYCQIELGNKSPSLETIINIADAMQVSIDTLVQGASRQAFHLYQQPQLRRSSRPWCSHHPCFASCCGSISNHRSSN